MLKVFLCIFFASLSTVSMAANEQVADLFDMSLDELMGVKLDIASRRPETMRQAPSAVTVFSRSEIKAMGIDNVYDLLNYVPGFQVTRSIDVVEEALVHSRGVANLNGEVLFMLNGHRLNENSQGRATRFVRYIPTANVKQVEIIRGPGSALYGANALLGVVNIITVSGVNEVGVHGGSYDNHGGYVNLYRKVGGLDIDASFSFDRDRGEKYNISGAETRDPQQDINFYSSFSFNSTKLDLGYLQHKNQDFISFNGVGDVGTTWADTKYLLAAISHVWQLGSDLKIKGGLSYTRHSIESAGWFKAANPPSYSEDFLLGPYSQNSAYDANLDASYTINPESSLDWGLVYRRAGQDYLGVCTNYLSPSHSLTPSDANYLGECLLEKDIPSLDSREVLLTNYGVYSQYRRQLTTHLNLIAGLRFDHYEVSGNATSPRIGLVWQHKKTTLKAFWGSAFRVPTIAELYTDSPRSQGNTSLEPQKVETTEIVLQQRIKRFELEGVLFHTKEIDPIERFVSGGVQSWQNGSTHNYEGGEARVIWDVCTDLRLYLTHTHIFTNLSPSSYDDFSSAIVNYQTKKWSFNLNGIYRDTQDVALNDQNDYIVVNTKVSYQFNPALLIYGKADNLFDYDYATYESDVSSTAFDSVPNKGLRLVLGMDTKW